MENTPVEQKQDKKHKNDAVETTRVSNVHPILHDSTDLAGPHLGVMNHLQVMVVLQLFIIPVYPYVSQCKMHVTVCLLVSCYHRFIKTKCQNVPQNGIFHDIRY